MREFNIWQIRDNDFKLVFCSTFSVFFIFITLIILGTQICKLGTFPFCLETKVGFNLMILKQNSFFYPSEGAPLASNEQIQQKCVNFRSKYSPETQMVPQSVIAAFRDSATLGATDNGKRIYILAGKSGLFCLIVCLFVS